jgi:hypothetical protein
MFLFDILNLIVQQLQLGDLKKKNQKIDNLQIKKQIKKRVRKLVKKFPIYEEYC